MADLNNISVNLPSGQKDIQILKCRDDRNPVFFKKNEEPCENNQAFQICDGSDCSWLKQDEKFGSDKLRPRIEPWLTALFQSEHLSLLAGSGLSQAVHLMATGSGLPGMATAKFSVYDEKIQNMAKKSAEKADRDGVNIEDQVRVASDLLRGLECYCPKDSEFRGSRKMKKDIQLLQNELKRILSEFAVNILKGENDVVARQDACEEAFNYLVSFLMSFASRSGTRDRLNIFTTNYDRFIEAGAEIAGLHLLDRFVGSIAPIFRSSRLDIDIHYNPPGIRGEPRYLEGVARFSKLHGSIDWASSERDIRRIGVPFGAETIEPYLNSPGLKEINAMRLMIYPNSTKDRETADYPYVELFRDFASAICRPNGALITYGYSFSDEHINRVIEDMLTIPSTHLVVISFSDPMGRIMKMYKKLSGRRSQITLMIGDHLGNFQSLVDHYLPKPAIDRTTFRMAELLKSRWGVDKGDQKDTDLELKQNPSDQKRPEGDL